MNANAPRFHSDAIDHTIDRALSALRDAQPRSGSEMFAGRILANLEHRTAASQPARFHLSAHFALWTAASAAVLAIASLVILHQPGAPSSTRIARQGGVGMTVLPTSRALVQNRASQLASGSPRTSIEPTHRMAHRSAMPVPCTQSGCPIHDGDAHAVMNGASQTPSDAQLLADLHAPSHPAPPLPLTSQEKLFLRMLQYGNATQLAELDPLIRAKHDADETTAFKTFFPDPPPLKQPLGDAE